MPNLRNLVVLALIVLPWSYSAEAGTVRIALLMSASVASDSLVLAQLLPANIPRNIRASAERVSLGSAPQLGATRVIEHDALASAISGGGMSPLQFDIPPSVTIERRYRVISPDDVLDAIQASGASDRYPGFGALQAKDIFLEEEVRAPDGDLSLKVTQAARDPLIGRWRLRVVPSPSSGVLPFYATVRAGFSVASPAAGFTRGIDDIARSRRPNIAVIPNTPYLVSANRNACLHLHSSNVDMLLDVRPLEHGRLNDVVRVRLLASGRALQARVVREGFLDATL